LEKKSKNNLATVDIRLQNLFNEVIKYFDCTVIYGYRSPEEQNDLYQIGRTKPGTKVTNIDGYTKKSKHNYYPSRAVDVAPYPINFTDYKRIYMFIGYVLATAEQMGIRIRSGSDWDMDTEVTDQSFNDLLHFELLE
jgi:hypothetical protein